MGAFNFSGIGGGGSSAYGYLVDQLQIKENQLASDGKLSPGDYDVLTKMARTAFANPGLTPSQRSQLQVKMSGYEKGKSTTALSDNNDVSKLNREVQDEMTKGGMLYGNNPQAFLQRKSDVLAAKLSQLKDSIDQQEQSGDDSTGATNEFTAALSTYQDTQEALGIVKQAATNPSGGPATSDYAAYIKTNSKGEIVDVDVDRYGSKTGYSEVKATYGGIPIYGKINGKQDGRNIFKLGNQTFSAPDAFIPDVNNPGASKSVPLTLQDSQSKIGGTGITQDNANAPYVPIDLSRVTSQSYIPDNGFAKGSSGAIYRKGTDGKYEKWVNTDPKQVGATDNNMITLPRSMEQGILPMVAVTHDGSAPIQNPVPQTMAPATGTPPAGPQPAAPITPQAPAGGAGTSRTQAPVERSPQTAGGVANDTFSSAKSFIGGILGNLFGGSGQ